MYRIADGCFVVAIIALVMAIFILVVRILAF
jgi:hypothetical protein